MKATFRLILFSVFVALAVGCSDKAYEPDPAHIPKIPPGKKDVKNSKQNSPVPPSPKKR